MSDLGAVGVCISTALNFSGSLPCDLGLGEEAILASVRRRTATWSHGGGRGRGRAKGKGKGKGNGVTADWPGILRCLLYFDVNNIILPHDSHPHTSMIGPRRVDSSNPSCKSGAQSGRLSHGCWWCSCICGIVWVDHRCGYVCSIAVDDWMYCTSIQYHTKPAWRFRSASESREAKRD